MRSNIRSHPRNLRLSTFFPSLIQYDGKEYPTVEHLYQSLRYLNSSEIVDHEYAEVIRCAKTPYVARLLGDQYVINANMKWIRDIQQIIISFQRKGLKAVNNCTGTYEIMKFATRQKLVQNVDILRELSVFQDEIVYYSRYSSYWGIRKECVYNHGSPNAWYEWTGFNQYGKILMELRDELRESG
jgi:predicted NAD-dependent protein-ADP-ribosyltransferase YbiA (DUF1768 family)